MQASCKCIQGTAAGAPKCGSSSFGAEAEKEAVTLTRSLTVDLPLDQMSAADKKAFGMVDNLLDLGVGGRGCLSQGNIATARQGRC